MQTNLKIENLISWELVSKAAIAWLILVAIFFAIITIILRFHWKHYGVTEPTHKKLKKIYFTVSLGLFTFIAITAAIYFLI